jgi:hypothetical protein
MMVVIVIVIIVIVIVVIGMENIACVQDWRVALCGRLRLRTEL